MSSHSSFDPFFLLVSFQSKYLYKILNIFLEMDASEPERVNSLRL